MAMPYRKVDNSRAARPINATPRRRGPRGSPPPAKPPSASERFRELDRYRIEREWKRYEGTAQRDLFRELRSRFLDRHRAPGSWTLEVGPGPGRFSAGIGTPIATRVLVDLSIETLRFAHEHLGKGARPGQYRFLRADGLHLPFSPGRFSEVVALGNSLGFTGNSAPLLFQRLLESAAPSGVIIVEIAPGPGERSRYLRRLPPGAVGRLFEAPASVVRSRIEREGFVTEPSKPADRHGFRRLSTEEVVGWFSVAHCTVSETLAVAPATGVDSVRIEAVQRAPKAWSRLIEVEEALGRLSARQRSAAAVLIAARAPPAEGED
jgi:hypothetical protein